MTTTLAPRSSLLDGVPTSDIIRSARALEAREEARPLSEVEELTLIWLTAEISRRGGRVDPDALAYAVDAGQTQVEALLNLAPNFAA
ncbi:hypothetical protein SAMN05421776_11778 [Nocardia farcinica]|uniref:Uncharacterized protein n=1 Tax=Nocardia farcinica TaxID=37329 RepID=A0A0H5NWL7_NOCFR|nr:hypothetical protein [Nocardia farcinica]AXK86585.1 hypothetical protein DXT66_13960 [Nocardia farcinica]PFW99080.1 hypothetical protein CJ469_05686 [Nocardia farcinica]PFX06118.1 hypothetical protein CJ468_04984 [Nocardia farcinica]CRY79872.1 Uncharacterised protein [Nocardia farcinica]SIT33684.1 hypothetical protein SAMN05421776_11778 [Nocardia farcinica]